MEELSAELDWRGEAIPKLFLNKKQKNFNLNF